MPLVTVYIEHLRQAIHLADAQPASAYVYPQLMSAILPSGPPHAPNPTHGTEGRGAVVVLHIPPVCFQASLAIYLVLKRSIG